MEERQRALVDVRIAALQDDAVLMLQRNDDLFPGYWNLPGGHALPGEDALAAAVRELREETGLATVLTCLDFAAVSHIRPPGRSEKISFTFLCRQWSGTAQVREPSRFSSLTWALLAHLPTPVMTQADEAMRLICTNQRFSTYGLDNPIRGLPHGTSQRSRQGGRSPLTGHVLWKSALDSATG